MKNKYCPDDIHEVHVDFDTPYPHECFTCKALNRQREDMEKEILKRYLKDDPLKYVGQWINKTKKEIFSAEGYNPGEKQVALMNVNQIEKHFEVAKLIRKDFIQSLKDSAKKGEKV